MTLGAYLVAMNSKFLFDLSMCAQNYKMPCQIEKLQAID
jgi:hypothetical protein